MDVLFFRKINMKKIIGKYLLKLLGWKLKIHGDPKVLDRCILVVAPHTHNDEYLLGNFAFWQLGKPLKIIIKDAHTKAWYGGIVKALGGIGIDRSQRNDLINFVANEFKKEDFALVITPEGTRSFVEKWRKGFYHMAMTAKVPIVLAAGDFKTKTIYLGYHLPYEKYSTMSYEEILDDFRNYFIAHEIHPKVKENWNPNFQ